MRSFEISFPPDFDVQRFDESYKVGVFSYLAYRTLPDFYVSIGLQYLAARRSNGDVKMSSSVADIMSPSCITPLNEDMSIPIPVAGSCVECV